MRPHHGQLVDACYRNPPEHSLCGTPQASDRLCLIHADETSFGVIRDGRSSSNKSYMWVYCTGESEKYPIVLYDYRNNRKTDHPREFLRDYSGILVTMVTRPNIP